MTTYSKRWKLALLATFFVIVIRQISPAQDWPQWRGPNRDGVLAGFSEPKVWPEKLKPVWKVSVGGGHSSPVVAGERVFLHSRQGEEEVLSCLALNNGKLIWKQSYSVPYSMSPDAAQHGKGPKSTPIISDGKLYTFGITGVLSCFDVKTGKLFWRKEFSKEFKETSPLFGSSMSPLIDRGLLIVNIGGHDQGALTAFDALTGEVKWACKGDGPGQASPIMVDFGGVRQVVTQTQNHLVGVDAANGRLLWSIPFTTEYDQNIVTPLVYQQTLIYSGVFKETAAIKVVKKGDGWATEKAWANPGISMYMNSPVASGDLLYGFSHRNKGQFFCLDARTGATLWTSEGRYGENAAIVNAPEVLFLLTNDAQLLIVRKSAKKFDLIRRYTVAESPTWAHPVVVGHRVLIKDASNLALLSLD
jgi:outer membrane protein assembly factor BamB